MGKISKALAKYASERKRRARVPPAVPQLTAHDIKVLVAYDHQTGYLLKGDSRSGQVDECLIEELRESGTVQRLLENQLIHPTGKLTAQGMEEARRLAGVAARHARTRQPAVPARDRRLQKWSRPWTPRSMEEPDGMPPAVPAPSARKISLPYTTPRPMPERGAPSFCAPLRPLKVVAEPTPARPRGRRETASAAPAAADSYGGIAGCVSQGHCRRAGCALERGDHRPQPGRADGSALP